MFGHDQVLEFGVIRTHFHGGDTLQFFKVIFSSTLEDKKLRIPEKFVRKFGDELSAFVTITVPNSQV
ncbi:hypothetical protein ACOSQ4_020407 [Xanthoceras sorbifolium]